MSILNGLNDLIVIVVTSEQMREMDRLTIQKYGTPSLTLMERAGAGVVKAILERFVEPVSKGVLVVAGKGNNGGDGFVVGRLLTEQGVSCAIALLAKPNEISSDAAHNLEEYLTAGGKVVGIDRFGLSAPAPTAFKELGLTADSVIAAAQSL